VITLQQELEQIVELDSLEKIKSNMKNIMNNGFNLDDYVLNEIEQILDTQTVERTKYYINRLIKSLTEVRTNKVNNINLNRWKEYNDIITDSLWVLDKRDNSGAHNSNYWGNFIPQIPSQLIRRYTKEQEWVLDAFLGSGTTLIESKRLNRNGIGIELQSTVIELAKKNILADKDIFHIDNNIRTEIINADCVNLNYEKELNEIGINKVQLIILHPPYWDIIKFSSNENDLSNANTLQDFLTKMGKLIENVSKVLDKDRYLTLIISDKYENGEWIPLGFYTMQEVLKHNYILKSTIVKNFEETKAKLNQKELWRYRALVGGFYVFKHEYIFVFKKR
jgi:DNA modification methylase